MSYVPFLKFKVNEVAALSVLAESDKKNITPFFDLPRVDIISEDILKKIIDKALRKYQRHLSEIPYFYVDNFDIDDRVKINSKDNYHYLLEVFCDTSIIPVVGLDRSSERNQAVIDAKKNGFVASECVALRLTPEDFISYPLVRDDIEELLTSLESYFDSFHLIIDNRVCQNIDVEARADSIINFVIGICSDTHFNKIVVTGSSIPASIKDLLEPNNSLTTDRIELQVFTRVLDKIPSVILGDYTVISPLYSDNVLRKELMRKITAPKLMYSYKDKLFIMRGGALDGHSRGFKQYNDMAEILTNETFFRGKKYSFGDKYLVEKANNVGNDATPSTIPKSLINAHIVFMLNGFVY